MHYNSQGGSEGELKRQSSPASERKLQSAHSGYDDGVYEGKGVPSLQEKEIYVTDSGKVSNHMLNDKKEIPNLYYCAIIESDSDSQGQSDEEIHEGSLHMIEKHDYKPQQATKVENYADDPNWGPKGHERATSAEVAYLNNFPLSYHVIAEG